MKKIITIILLVAITLTAVYLVGIGFMQRYDVALGEFSVSEDIKTKAAVLNFII